MKNMNRLSVMKLSGAVLISLLLCLATAGAQESDKGMEKVAQAQSGCTLLRPLSWNGGGVTCLEKPTTPLSMANGQTYTAIASPTLLFGSGKTTVKCSYGRISTVKSYCKKSGGVLN